MYEVMFREGDGFRRDNFTVVTLTRSGLLKSLSAVNVNDHKISLIAYTGCFFFFGFSEGAVNQLF